MGQTGSGKTTLATSLARSYHAREVESIVLDPFKDPRWSTPYVFDDPVEFSRFARRARHAALFVDESGDLIGQHERALFWLATRARHYGHVSHFITQRAAQLSPTVRAQVSRLALFSVPRHDAELLAREWTHPEILQAPELRQGEFLWVERFKPARRLAIDLPTGVVYDPARSRGVKGAAGNGGPAARRGGPGAASGAGLRLESLPHPPSP
jgi:hypothetical protein